MMQFPGSIIRAASGKRALGATVTFARWRRGWPCNCYAAGARLAHAMPIAFLARAVAIALVIVGVLVVVRSGYLIAKW